MATCTMLLVTCNRLLYVNTLHLPWCESECELLKLPPYLTCCPSCLAGAVLYWLRVNGRLFGLDGIMVENLGGLGDGTSLLQNTPSYPSLVYFHIRQCLLIVH